MRRVLILGCSGAGKSTLSRRLAALTGLPRIELDHAYWRPGWREPTKEQWHQIVTALCEPPAWIMDGNSFATLPPRLARADTVIWLDYPRHFCLRRVLMRMVRAYTGARDGMPEGCVERFTLEFLSYVWNFNRQRRPRIIAAVNAHGAHAALHHLRGDADAERLVKELSQKRAEIQYIAAGRA